MNDETYRRRPTWQQAKWRICDRRPDGGGAGTRPGNQNTWNQIRWNIAKVVVPLALIAASQAPVARADVDGDTPSPGSCSYPAVGAFGLDGVAQHYVCDYPTEINGSHHHCVYGGAAATVGAQAGILIVSASIATNVGVLEGVCYWACPDGGVSPEPNPIQTWQGNAGQTKPVQRSKCNAIAPNPIQEPANSVLPQQEPVGSEPH